MLCTLSGYVIIRQATETDAPALVRLGQEFHEESTIDYPPVDYGVCQSNLASLKLNPSFTVLVAESNDEIIGFLTAFLSQYTFSLEIVAGCDLFFVTKRRRGSGAAVRLLKEFQAWAKRNGAWDSSISLDAQQTDKKTARFLERMGFVHTQGAYHKRLWGSF